VDGAPVHKALCRGSFGRSDHFGAMFNILHDDPVQSTSTGSLASTPHVNGHAKDTTVWCACITLLQATSGRGGWNDNLQIPQAIEDEIAAAVRNIDIILTNAGASWGHVVQVNTCHVGGFLPVVNDTIVNLYHQCMLSHAPVWTQLGVEALGLPAMRFEMHIAAMIH